MKVKMIKERLYYRAPNAAVALAVHIKGLDEPRVLKKAIEKAIQHHEVLRSKIVQDKAGDVYYELLPKSIIKIEIVKEAEQKDLEAFIIEQIRIPFKISEGELMRFFIRQQEGYLELLLMAHHIVGDGLSYTYLIRDIMNYLENPNREEITLPLVSFNENQVPQKAKLNPFLKLMIRLLNKQWGKEKKLFTEKEFLEMHERYWSKRQIHMFTANFTEAEITRLKEKCKAHGVTINTALVTAFSYALGSKEDVGLSVSIRSQGFEGMRNDATGISIMCEPDSKQGFWEHAAYIHKLIYNNLESPSKKFFLLKFMNALEGTLIDATYFESFTNYENSIVTKVSQMFGYHGEPKGISISNLTQVAIPTKYDAYEIDNLLFVPPLVPNAKRMIGVATLGDTMILSMQFLKGKENREMKGTFDKAIQYLKD